jgi:transposase
MCALPLVIETGGEASMMNKLEVFRAALGLPDPWRVVRTNFDPERRWLDLHLDFRPGARFPCSEGDEDACPVHDTVDKAWRHLDFFQHRAYLHARVPRVRRPEHGVRLVAVPWARPESGFTLLFEALAMELIALRLTSCQRIQSESDHLS